MGKGVRRNAPRIESIVSGLFPPIQKMVPKVSFLTVVWGESYIARFASLALPSFLAPGNLPALAKMVDLEVVIMTQRNDIPFFENHRTFLVLKAICPVRFVEIDDLITAGNYGVTLTLAYLRPIASMGKKMLDSHFLFMNADFVLADGSLGSLGRHILAGRSIILGPSFRATAEDVEPALHGLVDDRTGVLAIPPRKLTALSLAHPHPTTVAKTVNQKLYHSLHPNQLFWQVNDHCVLGHYFLIFMLCLKPERVIESINSYCDYAFIPEMCPSGNEVAMGDSDEFFMLELQQRDQEGNLLRLGQTTEKDVARSLQYWTTREHRRAARHEIFFHSEDLPQDLDKFRKEANALLERLEKKLGPPLSHAGHFYWVHGVAAWQYHRENQRLSIAPPELAPLSKNSSHWRRRLLRWSLALMYASRPLFHRLRNTPLHPYWLDYRHLKNIVGSPSPKTGGRALFIQDHQGRLDGFASDHASARLINLEDLLEQHEPPGEQFSCLVIYLTHNNSHRVQDIIKYCNPMMTPAFYCKVFIHNLGGEFENRDFSTELINQAEKIIGQPPKNVRCSFVGGRLKRANARLFLRLSGHYTHFGAMALLWVIPMMAICLPLSTLINLYLVCSQPTPAGITLCSSVALEFEEYSQ